ncbi:hypothetical protein HDC90_002838 [Pedobacter sp. AK013]|uniref:hypothetical protein n=1 Tax=Pedobacter sp. AK013 TaxID=2723071 RepID=UPI001612B721|nr:hypothetical protein [Pedobacter sp. AK013]MBB6238206.1 hypothetical protein [Pedobacter sp. AK013]
MKKKLFLIAILSTIIFEAFSQSTNRKIYFLADTINISPPNRFLKIETISFFEHHFTFFCKCMPPYKSYTTFSYIDKKGDKKAEIVSKKPDYPYISFKELMDISSEQNSYDLYITEVLPGNKYRTNKVHFVPYRTPIDDGVVVNKENK